MNIFAHIDIVVMFVKASETPKPAFGSVPFSQSGFGSQSSGGFSGGSFSSQGGGVLASGFGFGGGASSTGKLCQRRRAC